MVSANGSRDVECHLGGGEGARAGARDGTVPRYG